jgi:peptide deformylase
MVLPIVAYGDPVLKRRAAPVDVSDPALPALVENLFETMYNAKGVGLAAPQVGLSVRLFVVDGSPFAEDEDNAAQAEVLKTYKRAFYNPEVLEESGDLWGFEEGCLSIPDVHETVHRKPVVRFKHQLLDGSWEEMQLDGLAARIFQHEYDHIEGVLFTDRLSALRKRLLQGRLGNIAKGLIQVGYRMKFPQSR